MDMFIIITAVIITTIGIVAGIITIKRYFFHKSPEETAAPVIKKQAELKQDTEEIKLDLKRITRQLEEKGYKPDQKTISEYEAKIKELEKELGERTPTDARAKNALTAFKKGDYEEARKLFEALRAEGKTAVKEQAEIAYNLGNVYFVELRFTDALHAYLDAERLDSESTLYINEAGYLFHTLAQYDKAIEYYEKALRSDLKSLGDEHPSVATRWNNLGMAWKAKGEYDKAIEYYEKALRSNLKSLGEDHPDVARDQNNLGSAWQAKGDYDKAIEYYEKALRSDLESLGENHPNVAEGWNNLGTAWHDKSDYDKAIEYYKKALSVSQKVLGKDHPQTKTINKNLNDAKEKRK